MSKDNEKKVAGPVITIKKFFGMSTAEAAREIKALSRDERIELAEMIAKSEKA